MEPGAPAVDPPACRPETASVDRRRRAWAVAGLVGLLVLAAYSPTLRGGLLQWDDAGYVLENQGIRSLSLRTVWWALTEFCCNYWAPLTWLSLAADHALWGLEPFGYHLTNNLLHALNAALLVLVASRLLARAARDPAGQVTGQALAGAALASLAWALHPLRVESVAWVTERKDVLSACFGLAAVLAYLRHADGEAADDASAPGWGFLRRPAYLAALALYGLSLLSKAMLVTLPVALLVLDWFPLRRLDAARLGRRLAEKVPLLLMAGGASLVTMTAMAPTARTLAEIGLGTRLLVAFTSLVAYLRLTLVPLGISPVYFHPNVVELTPAVAGAVALVLLLSAAVAVAARRHPAPLAAWLLFLVTVLPVIGLTQNGKQELAPRFTYVPGMALAVLAGGWLAPRLLRLVGAARLVAGVALAAALGLLVAVSVRDIGHWRDDVTLWSRVIELDPAFGLSFAQRAHALRLAGRPAEALADVDRALVIAAARRYAAIHELHGQRAGVLLDLGRPDEAAAALTTAARVAPEPARTMYLMELDALRAGGR